MDIYQIVQDTARRFDEAELFYGHGTDNAWDEACYLVLGYFGLDFESSEIQLRQIKPQQNQIDDLNSLVKRRIEERIPVAYLLGRAEFYGLGFAVNESVLIPRSPIAELIVKNYAPWLQLEPHQPVAVLDMCCGSGCLGILAAYANENAEVLLSDISTKALELARINITDHQLDDRVKALESDLFENVHGEFDVLICNPPYVDAVDMANLPEEYKHEPSLALASGEDGLDLVRIVLAQAADFMKPGAVMFLELGNSAEHLLLQYPQVPWTWVDFEFGGDGVLVISKQELEQISDLFS